jgi:shikimate dehydrogenase
MGAPAELAALPCAVELLQERQLIVDLVYQPVRTGLLRAADAVGARSLNGVGMLLYQAAVAFELWTGERAPIDAMRGAVEPELGG